MQYRRPVGRGPSGNTWPRCASHRLQTASVRRIPYSLSSCAATLSLVSVEFIASANPTSRSLLDSTLECAIYHGIYQKKKGAEWLGLPSYFEMAGVRRFDYRRNIASTGRKCLSAAIPLPEM